MGVKSVKKFGTLNRLISFTCLFSFFVLITAEISHADRKRHHRKTRVAAKSQKIKRKSINFSNLDQRSDADVRDEVKDLISSYGNQELYDSFTVLQWRRLKERAQPSWEEDAVDVEGQRSLVGKAFAVQLSNSLLPMIKRSDLREVYRTTERNVKSFREQMRYEIKDDGNGYTSSKKATGERLFQFDINLNPNEGLSPLVRFNDSWRCRYDPFEGKTFLEYGIDF